MPRPRTAVRRPRPMLQGVLQDAGASQRRCARQRRQSGRDQCRGKCDGDRRLAMPAPSRWHRHRSAGLCDPGHGHRNVELRADAIVVNSGLIDVGGSALADGAEGTAYGLLHGYRPERYRLCSMSSGGTATGSAVAFASVDNTGSINVHANASAVEDGGYANASAGASAINQDAGAFAECHRLPRLSCR